MFKVPEKYRVTTGKMASAKSDGNNGCFVIPMGGKFHAYVIAGCGNGWEHISVHIAARKNLVKTPTHAQMCKIKELFWGDEAVVMQLHPKKTDSWKQYEGVLHLWRPTEVSGVHIPIPPSQLTDLRNVRQDLAHDLPIPGLMKGL